jgi:hypothetical protein
VSQYFIVGILRQRVHDAAAELADFCDDCGGVDVEGGVARHCGGLEEGAVSARRSKCHGAAAAVLLGVGLREGTVAPSTKGTLSTLDRNLYMPNVGLQEITALHCTILITSSKT